MASHYSHRRSSLTSLGNSPRSRQTQQRPHKWFRFSMAPSMSGGRYAATRNMSLKMARTSGGGGGGTSGRFQGGRHIPENV